MRTDGQFTLNNATFPITRTGLLAIILQQNIVVGRRECVAVLVDGLAATVVRIGAPNVVRFQIWICFASRAAARTMHADRAHAN